MNFSKTNVLPKLGIKFILIKILFEINGRHELDQSIFENEFFPFTPKSLDLKDTLNPKLFLISLDEIGLIFEKIALLN